MRPSTRPSRGTPAAWLARAVRVASHAVLLAAAVAAAGCGSDPDPELMLLTAARWNANPMTLADIGYEVAVDFGWPSRAQSCFPPPVGLKVTLNDRVIIPEHTGDCEWDILVRFAAVAPEAPITVRVESGGRVLGEATYTGLFPGFGAQLVVPADGKVRAGDAVTLTLPTTEMPAGDVYLGYFYWLDTPPTMPPYHTYGAGAKGTEPGTITIAAPTTIGRALLMVGTVFNTNYVPAQSCSGFTSCSALPDAYTVGPIPIEVIPSTSPP